MPTASSSGCVLPAAGRFGGFILAMITIFQPESLAVDRPVVAAFEGVSSAPWSCVSSTSRASSIGHRDPGGLDDRGGICS